MPHDPVLAVRFAALAVAQAAKLGERDDDAVARLQRMALRALPEGHRLGRAIGEFATRSREARHAPDALRELGHALAHVIEVDAMPVPPDLDRRDIHG